MVRAATKASKIKGNGVQDGLAVLNLLLVHGNLQFLTGWRIETFDTDKKSIRILHGGSFWTHRALLLAASDTPEEQERSEALHRLELVVDGRLHPLPPLALHVPRGSPCDQSWRKNTRDPVRLEVSILKPATTRLARRGENEISAMICSKPRLHRQLLLLHPTDPTMDDADDDLFRCAICGTTEGDSSNLTSQTSLQTNATVRCGHQLYVCWSRLVRGPAHFTHALIVLSISCNSCIDRELVRKREFPCPICQNPVKRVTLTQRTLDDVQCEKDTSWRRRVLKVFNKTEKDFPSLLEYNNYLEEVEDMVFSIVNEEPQAEEFKAKIKEYEQAHKAEIVIRQSQRADEERSIQDRIAAEQRESERNRREVIEEEKAIAATKRKLKQESTEVLLGEREEVSAELRAAQMQGYRNELKRQSRGKAATNFVSPRVREPEGGWLREGKMDRELYRKRQEAGGGIPVGSIASFERNWNETVSSLFSRPQQ